MQMYTLKEASRKAKIGLDTLKRACEEGLIKATQTANRQWRITENALEQALDEGLDLRGLSKRTKSKRAMPAGLKAYRDKQKASKK